MKTIEECKRAAARLLGMRQHREGRWRQLRKFICPWRGVFAGRVEDSPAAGERLRFTQTASQAVLRGASGMTSGMTPRNISWFKPDFIEPGLREASGARMWLDHIDGQIKDCLAAGGFYQAIQAFNTDLIWAGCALLFAEEDQPLRYECPQVGTWAVGLNSRGGLEHVLRQCRIPAYELARLFEAGSLSPQARAMLKRRPLDAALVWHLVCPEPDNGPHPFASYWWEEGANRFLRVGGYYEMPFFYTCWHEGVTPYGTGPGDEALPDAMQLDKLERHKLEGLAKIVSPPMQGPCSLKGHVRLGPNDINYTDSPARITPIMDLGPVAQALPNIRDEIRVVAQRLEQSLMAAIFSSVSLEQRPPRHERHRISGTQARGPAAARPRRFRL